MEIFCPDCSASAVQIAAEGVDLYESYLPHTDRWRQLAERYRDTHIYECLGCYFQFRHPYPGNQELHAAYSQMVNDHWDYQPTCNSAWNIASNIVKRIHKGQNGLNVLDVGAYDGRFLGLLPHDVHRYAIEPSLVAAETLKSNGVTWVGADVSEVDKSFLGRFDVITMFDVFEHVIQPSEYLRKMVSLLKPQGSLLISTGNSDHWSRRLLCHKHWYVHTLQHVSFGSRRYFTQRSAFLKLKLQQVKHISHQAGPFARRLSDAAKTYMTGHQQNWWIRWLLRAASPFSETAVRAYSSPGGPYAPYLRDHLLVHYVRP